METNLNKEQLEAVTNFNGPMLCIAGAGTGKTKTLVHRVGEMIKQGIEPENILLLTFTRNAAQTMLEQTAELIGVKALKVAGGTYHGFAVKLIREHAKLLGLGNEINIITNKDSEDLIDLLMKEKLPLGLNLPNKNAIYRIFSAAFNLGYSVADYIEKHHPDFLNPILKRANDSSLHGQTKLEDFATAPITTMAEAIEFLHDELSIYKQENNLLDYDDLICQHLF